MFGKVVAAAVASFWLAHAAVAGEMQYPAPDGTIVTAHTYGSGTRGAIIVHEEGRTHEDWRDLAKALASSGFHVIVPDLRGHGSTPGELNEETWPEMIHDVEGAIAFLAKEGAETISLVGAEMGGNLVLNAAAAEPRVDRVVIISPRLSSHGYRLSTGLTGYGARPLYLITSTDDTTGTRAAQALESRITGDKKIQTLDVRGEGYQLTQREPTLLGDIVAWLRSDPTSDAAGPRTDQLRSGDLDDLETTGKRIGE